MTRVRRDAASERDHAGGATPAALREAVDATVAARWSPEVTVGQWWAALADAGLSQPAWPWGHGGRRCRPADARIVSDALAAAGTIPAPSGGVGATLAGPTLLAHGTAAQLDRYLLAIANGREAWCQLFSEPGAGSDLASLETRAEPVGHGWAITGQKVWNSGADVARRGLLLARTDRQAPQHLGLTMFALDMNQAGVRVRPLVQMNGESDFCEVFIDGARVTPGEVIGAVGDGWNVTRTTLRYERQSVTDRRTGAAALKSGEKSGSLERRVVEVLDEISRRGSEQVTGYAVPSRGLFELARQQGRAGDPVLRQRLVRYYARNRLNRLTAQRLRETAVLPPGGQGPINKLGLVASCLQSSEIVFDLLGPAGMLWGPDAPLGGTLQRSALGSPGARIGAGTDEIQRNVLAERALGLPRSV